MVLLRAQGEPVNGADYNGPADDLPRQLRPVSCAPLSTPFLAACPLTTSHLFLISTRDFENQ